MNIYQMYHPVKMRHKSNLISLILGPRNNLQFTWCHERVYFIVPSLYFYGAETILGLALSKPQI